MAREHLEALGEQLGYVEWRDRPPDDDDVFVVQLELTGDEISGWRLDQVRSVRDAASRRMVYSTWIAEEDAALGVRIDANLGGSRTEARDQLLERLASVQLPQVQRLPAGTVGDVGFALGDNNLVLFSRGNVVVEVATLGSSAIDVLALARAFDDHLMARPEVASSAASGRPRRAAVDTAAWTAALARSAPAERTALPESPSLRRALAEPRTHDELGLPRFVPIAAPDAAINDEASTGASRRPQAGRRAASTIKLFVRNGEIREADGRLWFIASDAGDRIIEVYEDDPEPAIPDGGGSTHDD